MREQRVLLEYGVQVSLVWRHVGDVHALKEHLAFVRRLETADDSQRGGLTTAGRTQQGDELVLVDGQVEIIQNLRIFK